MTTHRAEAWRLGYGAGEVFGWSCLDCPSTTSPLIDAEAAQKAADWHSRFPFGVPAGGTPGVDRDVTLADIVTVLADTYSAPGALIWLTAGNRNLDGASPQDLINVGRFVDVLDLALSLEG